MRLITAMEAIRLWHKSLHPTTRRNTHNKSAFRALDDAEDGRDDLGLRVGCQDVDNFEADLYYENDYHSRFNDFGFFLSRPN